MNSRHLIENQINLFLKSAKIVIFINDYVEDGRAKIISKSLSFNLNHQYHSAAVSHALNEANDGAPAKKISKPLTESLKKSLITYENNLIDIRKLLKLYGVSKEKISVVKLSQLNNFKEIENFLKEAFFSNQPRIKYPMVFIHGIFFGSDDEMNLAHNEGYLYELFRDTGLFNPMPTLSAVATPEARCNDDEDDDFLTDYSRNDSFIIDQVAKTNLSRKKNSKPNFSSLSKQLSFQTEFSSLSTFNKQLMCENYVKANCNNASSSLKCSSNHMDCMFRSECKMPVEDFEFKVDPERNSVKSSDGKRMTPPSEVLAVITKRSERFKEAIARRNEMLLNQIK